MQVRKATDEAGEKCQKDKDGNITNRGPRYLHSGLVKLGYPRTADALREVASGKEDEVSMKHRFWSKAAELYTREESLDVDDFGKPKVLYRQLNWALRNDDASLWDWASYFGAHVICVLTNDPRISTSRFHR